MINEQGLTTSAWPASQRKHRWRSHCSVYAAALAVLGGSAISVTATATASAGPSPATTLVASADRYSAVIRRTEFGVPHVVGRTFGDLGYGYGYAVAQDYLCALADLVLTADGDRSRFFGPDRCSRRSSGSPTSSPNTRS